jgi:hypothetical protein
MRIFALFLLLQLTGSPVFGATFAFSGVILDVPEGFEGPIQDERESAKVVAFVKKYPRSREGTLLQISIWDFGQALLGMPEEARMEGTQHYLEQFLSGVGRRREEFMVTSRGNSSLSGIPSARAEWTGIAEGRRMSGVMYCVIVGTRVMSFHTQDFEDAPPQNRASALSAIEKVTFGEEG